VRRYLLVGRLLYSAIASLDGYIEDESGKFDWAVPDEEVLSFVNDLERPVVTYLYGRRMYETMVAWESIDDPRPFIQDFAQIWRKAEKVVYSRSLESVSSARTRIERDFDPEAVQRLKDEAPADMSIGGPDLAGQAIKARLVDEYQLFLVPVLVGGGKRAFPDGVPRELEPLGHRRFDSGVVYLQYRQR
jgi:dihydrofolate reductase